MSEQEKRPRGRPKLAYNARVVSTRLPEQVITKLEAEAERTGTSMSRLLMEIIKGARPYIEWEVMNGQGSS